MQRYSTLLVTSLFLVTSASAQSRGIGTLYEANLPGDAVLPLGALNVGATIAATDSDPDPFEPLQITGAARLPNGHYILSSSGVVSTDPAVPNPSSRHTFYEIDANGTVLATIFQPDGPPQLDGRGLQDLGWDQDTGPDSRIWSGTDGKAVYPFDWNTGTFDPLIGFDEHTIKILEGWQGNSIYCCTVAIIGGEKVLVTANTRNPDLVNNPQPFLGDPTNWHLIETPAATASPFTDFAKFRDSTPDPTDGDILAVGFQDAGKFGLAFDPVHETLWYAVDEEFANPNPNQSTLRFIEMDIDGNRTGKVYQAPRSIGEFGDPAGDFLPFARGCEMYVDGDGSLVMLFVAGILNGSSHEIMVEVNGSFDFGSSCGGGDIGYVSEPFVGNLNDFQITLENAPPNPLSSAFLFRNPPVAEPGLMIPGINNCPLLLNLGNLRSMGSFTLVNGAASFHQVLPDNQGLVGIQVGFQWLLPSGPAGLPLDLSAAGVVRLGENQ